MKIDAVMFCLSPGIKPRVEEVYAAEAEAARAMPAPTTAASGEGVACVIGGG